MINSPDPSIYRDRERQVIDHVERLMRDYRLRIDTGEGQRHIVALLREVKHEDRQIELKRLMAELGVFDRLLESKMPLGRRLTITVSRTRLLLLVKTMARIEVVCLPPWRALLAGQTPTAMTRAELESSLTQIKGDQRVPVTYVLVSASGFEPEARKLAERSQSRTIILLEPNDAGGWKATAPTELPELAMLFDPELDADKRKRVREEVAGNQADLLSGGLSAEKIATLAQLPVELVEDELESYARDAGMQARRLDGNVVLYRDGGPGATGGLGGSTMPFIERLKAVFAGKVDNEKKIRLLSERRAALSVHRDRSYDEMGVLEKRESDLRDQFKATTSGITRRRITSQLVQLRKDLDRRQQLLGMLNQQIDIVSTHLHNLELVRQGKAAQLPSSEDLAKDAAAAEEVLAELQADSEVAGSMATTGPGGLTDEERALYDELEREANAGKAPPATQTQPAQPRAASAPEPASGEIEFDEPPSASPRQKRPGEAEAG